MGLMVRKISKTASKKPRQRHQRQSTDLLLQHRRLLRESAISPDVARARGYRSVESEADLLKLGFSKHQLQVPALLIPTYSVYGEVAFYQIRPDHPRQRRGKPVKYEPPAGTRMSLDVHPRIRDQLADPTIPLWITEGSRKADSAISNGLCCISLLGVWNWRGTNEHGGKTALADWEMIALNGRLLILAFDSDVMEKPEVRLALDRLAAFLERRGATVRYAQLPPGPNGAKTGLDDFLAEHSVDDLEENIVDSLPPRTDLRLIRTADDAPTVDHKEVLTGQARHEHLAAFAAELWRKNVDPQHVTYRVIAANEASCDPPLEESEVSGVVDWAFRIPHEVFNGDKVITARLAKHLAMEGIIRRGEDGLLYRYQEGVFRPSGEAWLADQARLRLGSCFRRNHLEEVLYYIGKGKVQVSAEHCAHPDLINCTNGLLDWRNGKLQPHDADLVSLNQIPVAWRPDARCPRIEAFLEDVLPDGKAVEFWYEASGYALHDGNPLRKAILLYGSGGNGKSTALNLLRALLGAENVSSVPIQTLAENRFAPADLYGKVANICGDLDVRAIQRTDQFKQLTGGDTIRAERKHRDAFSFRWRGLPLFSTNEHLISHDQSPAWFDRWIIVPFEERIAGTERESLDLLSELTVREELEGYFVQAVAGLQRLMERGKFQLTPALQRMKTAYRDKADSVLAFVKECCQLDTSREGLKTFAIRRAELYVKYEIWCEEERRKPLNRPRFGKRFKRLFPEVQECRVRGSVLWRGLVMQPDYGGFRIPTPIVADRVVKKIRRRSSKRRKK